LNGQNGDEQGCDDDEPEKDEAKNVLFSGTQND
jgi:hypothetical protein